MLGCIVTHTVFLQPEKTGTLGVLNKILRGTGTDFLKNRECLGEADTNLIPKQVEKGSVWVRGTSLCFVTMTVFKVWSCYHLPQHPSWRTTPCRLSTAAYSIYSQLPSVLEAVPPSATWGRAMPWWHGSTLGG